MLVCARSDVASFSGDRVLPGLARVTGGDGGPGTVQLVVRDDVPAGLALLDAPDSDIGSRVAKQSPAQAMHVEMTQEIVDELLESVRNGQPPQILFGRSPVSLALLSKASAHRIMAPRWYQKQEKIGTPD